MFPFPSNIIKGRIRTLVLKYLHFKICLKSNFSLEQPMEGFLFIKNVPNTFLFKIIMFGNQREL